LKLFLAVLLLPLVIGVTISFWENLGLVKSAVASAFGWGVVSYLMLHILLYQPAQIYDTGKKITEKAIGFLSPMFKVAGFCIPIFTIFSFIAYFLATMVWKNHNLFPYFSFLAAFTLTMHIVMTANALKGKQAGWLKENYFFPMFLIYIVNILIVAGAFTLLSADFSILACWRRMTDVAGMITTASFRQLFVMEGR
jgi:hypothetical protein